MLDEPELETTVRELIIDICEVMHRRGFPAVSVGAIMRLVGVDEQQARNHDDELFDLSGDEFARMLEKRKFRSPDSVSSGATLH